MTWFERVNRIKCENVYKVCKYFYRNHDYFLALEYSDTGSWYPFSLGSNVELQIIMFCSVPQRAVADLDLQMREGGGHPDPKGGGDRSQKTLCQPFGPQFGLNITGELGPLGPSPGSATGERGSSIGGPEGYL